MTGPKTDLAEQLRDTVTDRALARAALSDADDRVLTAIHAALDGGVEPLVVANLTGVSRGRVYQIRDERRAAQDQEATP